MVAWEATLSSLEYSILILKDLTLNVNSAGAVAYSFV